MIQRIQSIFLVLIAISFGILFKLPFATSSVASSSFLADQHYTVQDHPILLGITFFGIGVSVLTIFLYKNRQLQRKLVYLIFALAAGLVLAAYLLLKQDTTTLAVRGGIHTQLGMFIPLLAIIFGWLANHYIKKDDKLVKSMDRLR